ncbi:MAG: tetratricopeptide repeat protein, partial [Verrucomicrobiae bacterium]|nr:tetratricopeptide repeat protein [Verrucomicrobiae bacterium]
MLILLIGRWTANAQSGNPTDETEWHALCKQGDDLRDQGDTEGEIQVRLKELKVAETNFGEHPTTAYTLEKLALAYLRTGKNGEALPLIKRVMDIRSKNLETIEKQLGPDDLSLVHPLWDLGWFWENLGKPQQAEPYWRRALAIQEKKYAKDSPEISDTLNGLGLCLMTQERYAEAADVFKRELIIREKFLRFRPNFLAPTLANVFDALNDADKDEEAVPYGTRSVEVYQANPATAQSWPLARIANNVGLCLSKLDRFEEADKYLSLSLSLREKLKPDSSQVAVVLVNLAEVRRKQRRFQESEVLIRRAVAIDEAEYGQDDNEVADDLWQLMELCVAAGRYPEAIKTGERMLSIRRASYPPNHPKVAVVLEKIGMANLFWGDYDAAEKA